MKRHQKKSVGGETLYREAATKTTSTRIVSSSRNKTKKAIQSTRINRELAVEESLVDFMRKAMHFRRAESIPNLYANGAILKTDEFAKARPKSHLVMG